MFKPRSEATGTPHRRGVAIAALFAVLALCTVAAAPAEGQTRGRAIGVAVVGDSLANDLGQGMEALHARNRRVQVVKHTRFATGLVRDDYFDWNKSVDLFLDHHRPGIIIVVIGGNDRQTIREDGRRFDPDTRAWQKEYEKRVASFMNELKKSRARVYWVGLPAVRSPSMSISFRMQNGIYRRQAAKHGFKYIDIWNTFLEDGAYSSFGMSLSGVKRQLRKSDGMHFTDEGKLRLANRISRAIGLR
ncbi:MAG: DUF459 domain-containing protein [Xanthobacteraceae bacterium]|uniref:SGNH/GDSL hydrolase family protein n=1 Tax=Pseudolabrys sp. TaxID=1960880 RepID=UPI003D0FA856